MKRRMLHVTAMFCLIALFAASSAIARVNKEAGPTLKSKTEAQTTVSTGKSRHVEQRLRKALGATEEQWRAIGPQVMKVHALVRQLADHGKASMPGVRKERSAAVRQPTPLGRATAALQELLANPAASPEAVRAQVATVRRERENLYKELQVARAELRQVLNERQQDQALLLGLLE